MAIGDTWETINTYAFVAGETIITAGFLNDAVNDLQYLYNRADTKVNAWTANTNTNVTITGSTNDILIGLSFTFTPSDDSVMCLFFAEDGEYSSPPVTYGYKVNSGAITYLSQDTATTRLNMFVITGLTSGSSNTITFYVKKTDAGNATLTTARAILWEMAN